MNNVESRKRLVEYRAKYIDELSRIKDSVSEKRYKWLVSVSKTYDLMKIQTAIGYVMALRELGHNIGDIKLYLENIRCELRNEIVSAAMERRHK